MSKKIIIVDDSALMRRIVCDIISMDSRFEVEDQAKDGLEALELLRKKSYDAMVLDVNMPRMNGLELLRQMQKERIRTRVMMFSTQTAKDTRETIEALELGAIDFIQKPEGVMDTGSDAFRVEFLTLLGVVARAYGSVHLDKVSYGKSSASGSASGTSSFGRPSSQTEHRSTFTRQTFTSMNSSGAITTRPGSVLPGEKVVAIASSTGGPKALQEVIPKLPGNLNAPVLVVQHMPKGFTKSLAERLDSLSQVHVKEAEDGDKLEKGCVYIAAGGKHMKVARSAGSYRIYYSDEPTREGVKPCANYMYESLVDSSFAQVCCTVLTGMGADGTEGIVNLEKKKKLYVIAQDEPSSTVYGMPKAIAQTGLVNEILPLDKVADAITKSVGTR
ncbi:MAG: chemotaxis response regulator protein-glutamate methylesterase [Lachnospiraceae bacterium]|nr:chemotaxis response regulator protein-glutamate methylesterase [Lachnospiraceae bacterium]